MTEQDIQQALDAALRLREGVPVYFRADGSSNVDDLNLIRDTLRSILEETQ